ncbi:hypothetical protein BCR44DRAFT_92718 [Catenaria anguillulae PL171]|uniref:G-protein coupled receptors family 3 profile domain-containing protein n=1 Tax=Catenaria anguillulae PL171 TaxID=765915 RepID=A0A1Y2HQ57_9FUNG|nr:hypothetical protein BCR44DRAFT_92718 [Catenaria anguillulae PL171]
MNMIPITLSAMKLFQLTLVAHQAVFLVLSWTTFFPSSLCQRATASTTAPVRIFFNDGRLTALKSDMQDYMNQWSSASGISVSAIFPNVSGFLSTTDYSRFMNLIQEQKRAYFDILYVDVIWPSLFSQNLLPLNELLSPGLLYQFNQEIIAAMQVNNRQLGLPLLITRPALYYRYDLLQKYNFSSPPQTWDEAEHMIRTIVPAERAAGKPNFHGYIGQLSPYEGLTCNVLEWIASYGGGTFVEPDATVSAMNPVKRDAMHAALSRLARWIKDGLVHPSALSSAETSSAAVWMRGDVLFMRNWIGSTWLTIANGVGALAPLPGATAELSGASTNGAGYFGVNRYTGNAAAATQVLEFLTSDQTARWLARRLGFLPARTALIQDAEIGRLTMAGNVSRPRIVSRPSGVAGAKYLRFSELVYQTTHQVLSGDRTVESAMDVWTYDVADLLSIDVLGPPKLVSVTDPAGIAAVVMVAIADAFLLIAAWPLLRGKWSRQLRRGSPRLMLALLSDLALVNCWPIAFLGQSDIACSVQPLIPAFGWTLILATVAVQDLQVFMITASPLRIMAMNVNRQLRIFLASCVTIQGLLSVVYVAINNPKVAVYRTSKTERYVGCGFAGGPETLGLLLLVPVLLVVGNVVLSVRSSVLNASSATRIHRIPTLRVIYLMLVLSLIALLSVFLTSIAKPVRVLILSGVIIAQSLGVTRLYVIPRIAGKDESMSTLAWMGVTQVGELDTSIAPSAATSEKRFSSAGKVTSGSDRGGNSTSMGSLSMFLEGEFAFRMARTELMLELTPSIQRRLRLLKDVGVLVVFELNGGKRSRHVVNLGGALARVDLTAIAHVRNGGGQLSQSTQQQQGLAIHMHHGWVLELCATGAGIAKLMGPWRTALEACCASQLGGDELARGTSVD